MWLKTILHDMKSKNLWFNVEIDMVQNRPLCRDWCLRLVLRTPSGACMSEKTIIRQRRYDKPSRFVGLRLNKARNSDCASELRNCGIPSLALSHSTQHVVQTAVGLTTRRHFGGGLHYLGGPHKKLSIDRLIDCTQSSNQLSTGSITQ